VYSGTRNTHERKSQSKRGKALTVSTFLVPPYRHKNKKEKRSGKVESCSDTAPSIEKREGGKKKEERKINHQGVYASMGPLSET